LNREHVRGFDDVWNVGFGGNFEVPFVRVA